MRMHMHTLPSGSGSLGRSSARCELRGAGCGLWAVALSSVMMQDVCMRHRSLWPVVVGT